MTTNGSDLGSPETIDERIDRLMKERREKTSPNLLAGKYEEFDQVKGVLTAFAETFVIEECLSAGKMVDRECMERKLLKKFMLTRGWDLSLEVRLNNGHVRWAHSIAWARERLAHPEVRILVKADDVPGRHYLLVANAEEIARKKLQEENMQSVRAEKEKELNGPKKKRKRAEAEIDESDAVYIIFDSKRPGCCKIGAGNGKCLARHREAKLWTNGEAELKHVEPVGSGRALRVESSVRYELGKDYRVNGEWVDCKYSTAVPVLEAWGKRARELDARENFAASKG
jgi:hypothetical protein